MGICSSKG
jgi:serine/threonine protein kinase